MSLEQWNAVEAYFDGLIIPPDAVLDPIFATNAAAGLPAHDVSPSQGKLLYLLARMMGAKRVLEIGTLGGYSTIWMGRALGKDGAIVTLELEPHHAEVARKNIAAAGLACPVDVRVGPASESLRALVAEGVPPFDFIFIDAHKRENPDYLEQSLQLSHPGTVIIADNVVRYGGVSDPQTTDIDVQGVQRFTEMVAANPRLSATVLQTVGSKGWDGFMLIVVS